MQPLECLNAERMALRDRLHHQASQDTRLVLRSQGTNVWRDSCAGEVVSKDAVARRRRTLFLPRDVARNSECPAFRLSGGRPLKAENPLLWQLGAQSSLAADVVPRATVTKDGGRRPRSRRSAAAPHSSRPVCSRRKWLKRWFQDLG